MVQQEIQGIIERIEAEEFPVRERHGDVLGVNIERPLPYLIVNRVAMERDRRLIANEPSYVWAAEGEDVAPLVKSVAQTLADRFGEMILVEFWVNDEERRRFRVMHGENATGAMIEALEDGFCRPVGTVSGLSVVRETLARRCPQGVDEFFQKDEGERLGVAKLGIELPALFSDPASGELFPILFRIFCRRFADTIKKAVYEFVRVQTSAGLRSYQMLGRRHLNEALWEVDRELARVARSFEFLLLVGPTNVRDAWQAFRRSRFRESPPFHYHQLPVDPERLKGDLYQIDIDRVDDPSLAFVLREKREELDTLITMLNDRDSRAFLHGSIKLFGTVEPALVEVAEELLSDFPEPEGEGSAVVDAQRFARRAEEEFAYYRKQDGSFDSTVEIREDVIGLMVSRGRLLVGKGMRVPEDRVEPLIHHEVGTHVLTFCNGAAQPLSLLRFGLAGYDELQEGIAVLAEYLVGGLGVPRLRTLAARVVAAQRLIDGAEFPETFRLLVEERGMKPSAAFGIVTRVYQSGGSVKDIIYLRGLLRLMKHLEEGGQLEPLFVGKIAAKHIPIVTELQERGVLKPTPILPRYLEREDCLERLERVRRGSSLREILKAEAL